MRRNKNIIVIGSFGYNISGPNGQTIKSQAVLRLLKDRSDDIIIPVDSVQIRKQPYKILGLITKFIQARTAIIIPGEDSLAYLFPVCFLMSVLFRTRLICICIGGWQYDFFMGQNGRRPHSIILKMCRRIKCFMPEMEMVNQELVSLLKFNNTKVLPNFRKFTHPVEISVSEKQLRLVFMARINREKGVPLLFDSVSILRKNNVDIRVTIYGHVYDEYKDEFERCLQNSADIVAYGGPIHADKVVDVLRQYDVLVLPTQYYTEGFPGSVLDAYIASIPVIVTEWKYSHEFVKEKESGLIIPFGCNAQTLAEAITTIYHDRNLLGRMKRGASHECIKYSDEHAWQILKDIL